MRCSRAPARRPKPATGWNRRGSPSTVSSQYPTASPPASAIALIRSARTPATLTAGPGPQRLDERPPPRPGAAASGLRSRARHERAARRRRIQGPGPVQSEGGPETQSPGPRERSERRGSVGMLHGIRSMTGSASPPARARTATGRADGRGRRNRPNRRRRRRSASVSSPSSSLRTTRVEPGQDRCGVVVSLGRGIRPQGADGVLPERESSTLASPSAPSEPSGGPLSSSVGSPLTWSSASSTTRPPDGGLALVNVVRPRLRSWPTVIASTLYAVRGSSCSVRQSRVMIRPLMMTGSPTNTLSAT